MNKQIDIFPYNKQIGPVQVTLCPDYSNDTMRWLINITSALENMPEKRIDGLVWQDAAKLIQQLTEVHGENLTVTYVIDQLK